MRLRFSHAGIEPRPWAIDVIAPAVPLPNAAPNPGYWPTLASIALMLVALGFTMRAYRRSEELAAMQRDFVAHVSHQLKTPLSALSAATETLQMDRVQSPQQLSQYLGIIQGEVEKLRDSLEHLLLNAIKFTPDGGCIRLTARPTADGGAQVHVADNGIGIDAASLPHIFDSFFTAFDVSRHSSGA